MLHIKLRLKIEVNSFFFQSLPYYVLYLKGALFFEYLRRILQYMVAMRNKNHGFLGIVF